ncbi:MAG: hypothetical protein MJZ41_06345 [Bacteroidaceae bacterium]|nr:hypothetical protein [Bacteroidaceae bacterium]
MAGNSVMKLNFEIIRAHILDPANNPLPSDCKQQFDLVCECGNLLQEYPEDRQIMKVLRSKSGTSHLSETCLRNTIKLARQVYKSRFDFDWDFWRAWEIKDQVDLVARAKKSGDLKAWNDAKKTLHSLIGEKPATVTDPRLKEKSKIVITVNNYGSKDSKPREMSLDDVRDLSEDEFEEVFDGVNSEITVEQAEAIMNS